MSQPGSRPELTCPRDSATRTRFPLEHGGLDREDVSSIMALDDAQARVSPTDDFGGPMGKGVFSAKVESNTAVPVERL